MALVFVGLGLWDERDISLRGLDEVRSADHLFAEFYTSTLGGASVERLETLYGKKITVLKREEVENSPGPLLEKAKAGTAVLLVGGDPMVATTHVDLRLRALSLGIPVRIVHGPSIVSAAAALAGLQSYKFGRSATVVAPFKPGMPVPRSAYDALRENLRRGLHTLLLLDPGLAIPRALELLEAVEEERREGVLPRTFVGVARAGSESPRVRAGTPDELRGVDFGGMPHVLVCPGELHFVEAEALKRLARPG
ncbi:MAG: diphthine synthase [Halobacteria archaeon]